MRNHILKFLTSFAVGGTERQFTYVTKSLDRSLFDVRIGCLVREGHFLQEIEALKLDVAEYPIRSLLGTKTLRRQWNFARDLRRNGVRLVHAYGFYANVFSIPAARLAGCLTIASVRDTGVFSDRVKSKTLLQKAACRFADCVIANSRAVRDWLVGLGVNANRIVVIRNGIMVAERQPRCSDFPVRHELGIPPDSPVIAAVCRLNRKKGIEYFLEAAATIKKQFPEARFLVVGSSNFDSTYEPQLKQLTRDLNLADRVIFTGERNDIPRLLREINLSVLPSLSEGLSNSLLEAMAAGLPVVATNVGGNPEVVEHGRTGLLVRPADATALSEAIIRIIKSAELARQFGDAGYERVKNHFSLDTTVRRTQQLYLSLLDSRCEQPPAAFGGSPPPRGGE